MGETHYCPECDKGQDYEGGRCTVCGLTFEQANVRQSERRLREERRREEETEDAE